MNITVHAEVEVNIELLERVGAYVDFVYIPELDRKIRLIFKVIPKHPKSDENVGQISGVAQSPVEEKKCTHAHCRCLNIDKKCPNKHYADCIGQGLMGKDRCKICGGELMFIRGRYPRNDNRQVCPTCLQERTEAITDMLNPNYGESKSV